MIDLRSLRYSILAADYQSFRKAALAMGVGQPTFSRRIRSLEDAIGVSIFERHSGGVRLTHAGLTFIATVRKAIHDIDTAISIAGLAGGGEIGRLSVGFYTSLSDAQKIAKLGDGIGGNGKRIRQKSALYRAQNDRKPFLPLVDVCHSACNFDPLKWGIGVQN